MLKVFYGTDRTAARDAAREATASYQGAVTVIDDMSFVPGEVASSVGATSLFGGSECYLLDTPSNDSEFYEEVKTHLGDMADSGNTFVILENSLLADQKRAYSKFAGSMEEFNADKPERFNSFAIAEALAKKDKKQMWVLLQQAKMAGLRDEEIVGMLWWQLKALRLAKVTRSADEAGMKDYPYKKAEQALRNFKDGEIEILSRSLLELYHDAHQGKREMDGALEEWVLTV